MRFRSIEIWKISLVAIEVAIYTTAMPFDRQNRGWNRGFRSTATVRGANFPIFFVGLFPVCSDITGG
jgi:hypothetical protein